MIISLCKNGYVCEYSTEIKEYHNMERLLRVINRRDLIWPVSKIKYHASEQSSSVGHLDFEMSF